MGKPIMLKKDMEKNIPHMRAPPKPLGGKVASWGEGLRTRLLTKLWPSCRGGETFQQLSGRDGMCRGNTGGCGLLWVLRGDVCTSTHVCTFWLSWMMCTTDD